MTSPVQAGSTPVPGFSCFTFVQWEEVFTCVPSSLCEYQEYSGQTLPRCYWPSWLGFHLLSPLPYLFSSLCSFLYSTLPVITPKNGLSICVGSSDEWFNNIHRCHFKILRLFIFALCLPWSSLAPPPPPFFFFPLSVNHRTNHRLIVDFKAAT